MDLHVSLRRRYKANRAVPMLVVVPVPQLCHPAMRLQQPAKRFDGSRPYSNHWRRPVRCVYLVAWLCSGLALENQLNVDLLS